MATEKLIRASDARSAVLKADPKSVYCIDNIKAVDAVEVVRCRDCIHNFVRYGENECYCGHPDGLNDILRPDDFCSYGERREGE